MRVKCDKLWVKRGLKGNVNDSTAVGKGGQSC